MNEEDRKAFDAWFDNVPGSCCHCESCKEQSKIGWQAAIEWERSRQSQQPDACKTCERIWTTSPEEVNRLKARIAELEDAKSAYEYKAHNSLEVAIEKVFEKLRSMPIEQLKAEIGKHKNGDIAQMLRETGALESADPEPERVFIPYDCDGWKKYFPMMAPDEIISHCKGAGQSRCPFCESDKSLWRTRKVVTTQRNAIATPAIGNDEWAIYVSAFAGDTPAMTIGDIPAKAIITFEVKE